MGLPGGPADLVRHVTNKPPAGSQDELPDPFGKPGYAGFYGYREDSESISSIERNFWAG